jgi:hypothetical protein
MRLASQDSPPQPLKRHSSPLPPLVVRLPSEVLSISFSFLPRHDLASVVLVCRDFRDPGEICLYRIVELSNELPNVHETIKLLGTTVGTNLREVILITASHRTSTKSTWFPPNVFKNWINLRRLELVGVPFGTGEDIDVFRRNLQEGCQKLQVVSYRHDAYERFPVRAFDLLRWSRDQMLG